MRTTRIRTMENAHVISPNKQIIGDVLAVIEADKKALDSNIAS